MQCSAVRRRRRQLMRVPKRWGANVENPRNARRSDDVKIIYISVAINIVLKTRTVRQYRTTSPRPYCYVDEATCIPRARLWVDATQIFVFVRLFSVP